MNFTTNNVDDLTKFPPISLFIPPTNNGSTQPNPRPQHYKLFEDLEIFEICCLILILLEHTFIFIITFKRKSLKRIPG